MAKMVDNGTEAAGLIEDCKTKFVLLVNQFNAYEFSVIKQQMSKFYQDKHIKVSLFIQDKLQSMNGTITINFVGKNVVNTPAGMKPGFIKIFTPESQRIPVDTKQIKMVHTSKVEDNNLELRIEGTTQAHLGMNMYAADRGSPVIPWTPDDQASQQKVPQDKAKPTKKGEEEKDEDAPSKGYKGMTGGGGATNEINALASLIVESANEVEKDNFKLNLFPDQPKDEKGASSKDDYDDTNVINIDLSQNQNVQKV